MNKTLENQNIFTSITTTASSLLSLLQLCPLPIPSLEGGQSDLSKQKLTCRSSWNPMLWLPLGKNQPPSVWCIKLYIYAGVYILVWLPLEPLLCSLRSHCLHLGSNHWTTPSFLVCQPLSTFEPPSSGRLYLLFSPKPIVSSLPFS